MTDDAELDAVLGDLVRAIFKAADSMLEANGLPKINADFLDGGIVLIPAATEGAMTFEESKVWLDGYMAAVKAHAQLPSLLTAYCQGLAAYAWWKDGTQYVGTCGGTLKGARVDAEARVKQGQRPWL